MSGKPRYGPKALEAAERSRLCRQRSADRHRANAGLIVALLAEAPADARQAYEQDPVFGPLIANARKVASQIEEVK